MNLALLIFDVEEEEFGGECPTCGFGEWNWRVQKLHAQAPLFKSFLAIELESEGNFPNVGRKKNEGKGKRVRENNKIGERIRILESSFQLGVHVVKVLSCLSLLPSLQKPLRDFHR